MEQLSRSLPEQIHLVIKLADKLIDALETLLADARVSDRLNAEWIREAAQNVSNYRNGLITAATTRDARAVERWSTCFFQMYKYFADETFAPDDSEAAVLKLVVAVKDAAIVIGQQIDPFDSGSLERTSTALVDFKNQ